MPTFPTFAAGNTMFWPCLSRRIYKNVSVSNEAGYPVSYNERSTPLMEWAWEGVSISNDDLATLTTFWESVEGAYEDFDITDEDTATTYSKCRFVGDDLQVRHVGFNDNVVDLVIRELV